MHLQDPDGALMDKKTHTLPGRDAITIGQMQPHSSCLEQLSTDTILFITVESENIERDTFVSPLPSPAQSDASFG